MPRSNGQAAVWNAVSAETARLAGDLSAGQELAGLRQRIDDLGSVVREMAQDTREALWEDIRNSQSTGAIVLGRRTMLEFLAIRTLGSQALRTTLVRPIGVPEPTLREKLYFIRSLGNLVTALMRDLGAENPSSVRVDAEEVIHILVEIARRQCNLEGIIDIEGALRWFTRIEPALYLWRQTYRDHLLHVTDVCLLGWLLLDSHLPPTRQTLAEHIGRMMGASQEYVYGNWFLTSLFHDVGYAADVIPQSVRSITYLKSRYLEQLRNEVLAARRRVGLLINEAALAGFLQTEEDGLDHGVLGYLHLKEILDSGIREASRRQRFSPACQAILKHSLKVPIEIASEPLSGLLILCDELQEWERPRISSRSFAARSREITSGGEQVEVPLGVISESLTLTGLRIRGGQFVFTGDELECVLTYRPPEIGKFWPQVIWVEKCHNLQRLNPSGFPLRLRLKLLNPYLNPATSKEYGFEALRNYALKHPEAGLLEFVDGRRNGLQVIAYSAQSGNIETMDFALDQLNAIPLLPDKLKVDWDDFIRCTIGRQDPYELEPLPLLREDT